MLSKNRPLQAIFKQKVLIFRMKKYYQTPVNRWENHYANGDNYFNQEWTYIETMQMSQPFDPKDAAKTRPEYYHQVHSNDFRYNKEIANTPRRHIVMGLKLKLYDKHSFDSLMHGNEWNDMMPDYQIEEPMSSNHYLQQGGHMRAFYLFVYLVIFVLSKSIILIF